MPFKAFDIRGNHKQATREGYNLLDTTEFEDNTSNGVSLVVNEDGTLELNGTATADTTFRILKTEKSITATGNENIVINKLNGTLEGTIRLICQDNDYGNIVYSQIGTSEFTNKLTADITYNIFSLQVYNGAVCNNLKLGLVISSSKTAYEQYGATPSVKIPSEIETTGENGSVNETVCNKNYFDKNSVFTTSNHQFNGKTGEIQQSGGPEWKALETYIPVKELTKYTLSGNIMLRSWTIAIWFYDSNKVGISKFNKNETSTYNFTTPKRTRYVRFSANTSVLDASTIQLEEGAKATDYIAHEEQNITMPCQQPMVSEEDFFDLENEKEVHNWGKVESYNGEEITTEYISTTGELSTGGTVYYKLATATQLDFTTEQKTVKEQIKNLHSYKNVTHIFSTDEVPPVTDVTYYKDLETTINSNKQETEARLEAIETLLSTTETSAMLLDNYETDLLEEVEQNA